MDTVFAFFRAVRHTLDRMERHITNQFEGIAMRKTTEREFKSKSQCEITEKKHYARPELVKKEKLLEVTGSGPPPT